MIKQGKHFETSFRKRKYHQSLQFLQVSSFLVLIFIQNPQLQMIDPQLYLFRSLSYIYNIIMDITIKTIDYDEEYPHNGTFQNISHHQNAKYERLKELEGECRVHSFRPLQFDLIKTIFLIIPLVGSVIGLLLLKYFKTLRVKCFYKDSPHEEATYFFIQSLDGHEEIQEVIRADQHIYVYFKSLKYRYVNSDLYPLGYQYQENFESLVSRNYLQNGITDNIKTSRQALFGRNQHKVDVPNYFQYMFEILTKPFFLFQYAICVILAFERLYIYTGIYLGFSFITTTINYILLYRSFVKIRDMAEKETDVIVIRNGNRVTVKNHDLVPGDVVIPVKNQEISYDGILMTGEIFVNEASLTGESIPVGKFPAKNLEEAKKDTAWIVEGSKVLEVRDQSRVVVINIGYATRRGRIIRKILTRVSKVADFFMSGVYFLLQALIVGCIIYACSVHMMVDRGIIPTFIVFRFLDILAWAFPPSFPIYFNVANSFSLVRLKRKNVFGTDPQKATEGANVKTFCFDKTGTLTQNEIEVHEIIKFSPEALHKTITNQLNAPQNSMISKLFASCHTTRQTEDGFLGDEVDLRMFLHSEYKMSVSSNSMIRFIVENASQKLQILRINQFQSKFQNMSVLVRDTKLKKHYVFVKGAPERIEKNSIVKFNYFETLVANMSLGGYRTIGYGYKEIDDAELSKYLQGERDIFEIDITALGIVAFENKLKADTRSTIDKLVESDIEPKMITGDNIFIAVETGFRAGILKEGEKVVLFEGRKQTNYAKGQYEGLLLFKQDGEIIQEKIQMRLDEYESTDKYAFAIDNDFLKLRPEPLLVPSVKLFARISPESKALIVKRFKTQYEANFQLLSCSDKMFGPQRWKVGMCGDGANDLMAIREADVGIGISDSDASYGASFTISNMQDVDFVIRESKNTCQTIVEIIRYFGTISFLKIITATIMVSDVTNYNAYQSIYFNFAHSLFLALFMALSSAADKPTRARPNSNLMSLQNHIVYWSNVIIPTIGFVAAYLYFRNSGLFKSNKNPIVTLEDGYKGVVNHTNTIMYLLINLPLIVNVFTIYRSYPFKCKFYQNIPLLVLTILNMIAAIAFFFTTAFMRTAFYVVSMPYQQSGICLLIMMVCLIVCYVFNELYLKLCSK